MKSGEINSLFKNLSRIIKNPRSDLKYKNKFTLLVSVVLSAQCTDTKSVNLFLYLRSLLGFLIALLKLLKREFISPDFI